MATVVQAKRDFGSFHSSNVQELIALPEEVYQPPMLPFQLPTFDHLVSFGAEMKEKHFYVDSERCWAFLNHGAFGAVIKEALTVAQSWQVYCERQPLKFLDRELLPQLVFVTRRLAKFVDADPTDMVLVQNVTTAMSTVVKSVIKEFQPTDSIFTLNVAYGATKKLLRQVGEERGITVDEIALTFPIQSGSEIVQVVEAALDERTTTKLAIFDHVPSNHGIILPVKELVTLCHTRGIQVLIDGAHALGSLPLSVRDIGADYYTSNAHKWLGNPKGCAFLYVAKQHQRRIRPLVISHGFGSGFSSEFIWTGLRDYSPFLALHTALDFWEAYGVDNIRQYIYKTARSGAELLVNTWDTCLLADKDMFGSMVLVALPEGMSMPEGGASGPCLSYSDAEAVQNTLYHEFKVEVPIKVIQGRLYARISAHVYSVQEDYSRLCQAVLVLTTRSRARPTQLPQ